MKKLRFVLSLFILCGVGATPVLCEKPPVKIGIMLALSGDLAPLGSEVRRGIEIAMRERNTRSVSLVVEDIQSLVPRAAVSAGQKLLRVEKVDLGITMIVEEAEPIAPIFSKAEVPLLVVWDSNESLRKAGRWVFSNGFSTELAGIRMAEFGAKKLNLSKVAIVRHDNPYSKIIGDSFSAAFKGKGGDVVIDESFDPTNTDYRTILAKIKSSEADGIYLPLIPMNSAVFLKQARQLGVALPLLSADPLIPYVIQAAAGAAEGVYLTNNFTEHAKELSDKYSSTFGSAPEDVVMVSLGYDGAKLALSAIDESDGTPSSVRDKLEKLLGPDRSADREQKLYQVKNSNYEEVDFAG